MTDYVPGAVSSFLSKTTGSKPLNASLSTLFGSPQSKKPVKCEKRKSSLLDTDLCSPNDGDQSVVPHKKKKKKIPTKTNSANSDHVDSETNTNERTVLKVETDSQNTIVKKKKKKKSKTESTADEINTETKSNNSEEEVSRSASQNSKKKPKKKGNKASLKPPTGDSSSGEESGEEETTAKVVSKKRRPDGDDSPSPKKKTKPTEEDGDPDKIKSDPEKDKRTVFVGNLPNGFQKKDVLKKFKKFGNIESVRIRSATPADLKIPVKAAIIRKELHPGKPSVNAYVVYTSEEDAVKAVQLNGAQVEEHHIRVDIVGNQKHDQSRSVFVGNLPFDTQEDSLRLHFKDCGIIANVRIIRDKKTGLGKGFGYVTFEKSESVMLAINLNGDKFLKRALRVMRSTNKAADQPTEAQKSGEKKKIKKEKKKKNSGDKKITMSGPTGGKHVKFEEDNNEPSSFQGLKAHKGDKSKKDKKKWKKRKPAKKNSIFKKAGSGGQKGNKFGKKTFAMNRLAKKMKRKSKN